MRLLGGLRFLPAATAAPAPPLPSRYSSIRTAAASTSAASTSNGVLPLLATWRRRRGGLSEAAASAPPLLLQQPLARTMTTAKQREAAEGGKKPKKEHEQQEKQPAIDNTGLLDGTHHGDPPSPSQIALHVRGARLQGGNVVWRATPPSSAKGSSSRGGGDGGGSGGGGGGFAAVAPEEVAGGSKEAVWERANAAAVGLSSSTDSAATTTAASTSSKKKKTHKELADFRSLGVIEPEKDVDLQLMIQNYTVPALAAGLRDREETLQLCAQLLAEGDLAQLEKILHPYQAGLITRRRRKTRSLDLQGGITSQHLNMLRKYLQRSPRQLTRAVSLRASVVIPLCNVDGVASLLFERRSPKVRSFKNQVCFPGGMVEEARDVNIIETSLREMEEEIGFPAQQVDVLGVLRCDWSEVHKITGIGVTPVVGYLGDLTARTLAPNPDEVSECFTVPLSALLKEENWNDDQEKATVVFVGGPHIVWGLTAYIARRFLTDILNRYKIKC